MYISGGENVYPAEVEAYIVKNDNVKEVSVIGVPDKRWGEVGHAFVVLNSDDKTNENDILKFCKGNLAKYKVPKYVSFLNELPRNEAGKINRIELLESHKTKHE